MMQSRWQGKFLSQLDIVRENTQDEKLPFWMSKIKFQVVRFGRAEQLGFKNDLDFFEATCKDDPRTKHVLLQPATTMRPDGLVLLKRYLKVDSNGKEDENELLEERPTGEYRLRWFAVVIGAKVYSSAVHKETHQSNVSSTDLTLAYCQS